MATQATSPYFLTPEMGMSKEAMRQKMAYALLQQGSSGEPVQAWSQGLARMAQGALGGYELGMAANEEKAREASIAGALNNMPGMGPPQDAPQSPPMQPPPSGPLQPRPVPTQPQPPMARSPVAAALGQGNIPAPARPAVMPSARVMGDQEAVNAGIYPPEAAPVNGVAPAMTPNARVAQALGPTQTQAPNISQVDQEGIRNLWQNPATRPLALERYQQLSKPKDQDVPLVDPKERAAAGIPASDISPYQRNMATGKISPINTQPNISVNSVANPVLEGVGKQLVAAREKAETAVNTIPILHDARKALDEGATTGAAADWRVKFQKLGALFGMDAKEAVNSEVFLNTIGREVLAHAKSLGPNPSNADRDYIKAVEAGDIKLEEKSIRRLLDISERNQRQSIKWFNSQSEKLMRGSPDTYKQIAPLMQFDEPGAYSYKPTVAPAQQPSGSAVRRFNPATGKIE